MKDKSKKVLDKFLDEGDIEALRQRFGYKTRLSVYDSLRLKSNTERSQAIRSYVLNTLPYLHQAIGKVLENAQQLVDLDNCDSTVLDDLRKTLNH